MDQIDPSEVQGEPRGMEPFRRLWRGVLHRAIKDGLGETGGVGVTPMEKHQAHMNAILWWTAPGYAEERELVISWAGHDPEWVTEIMRRRMRERAGRG